MAEPSRIFVVAGEPSGDRIGAELIKKLRGHGRQVQASGVGGAELEGEGLRSLFPMGDLSVMGLTDVLKRLPLLYRRMRQTSEAIVAANPDLVIFVDSQVFSQTVAKRIRKAGFKGDTMLYVAPSVWAWKPERAPALRPIYDEVLAVLPFEPAVMKRLGGPLTTYVGHPALDHTVFRKHQPERGPLLLLPGSRAGELRRHLPIMRDVANALAQHPSVSGFVVPTLRSVEPMVREATSTWGVPVEVTTSATDRHAAFANGVAAAAVSGTITLELALSGTPMVITYVGDRAQRRRWRKYNGEFVGLPNILFGSSLAPEILDIRPRPADVIDALKKLLDEPASMDRQRDGFASIRVEMEKGTPGAPLVDAAERVLVHLPQRRSTGK
jgi:lipid-A-disaccharide synthase